MDLFLKLNVTMLTLYVTMRYCVAIFKKAPGKDYKKGYCNLVFQNGKGEFQFFSIFSKKP